MQKPKTPLQKSLFLDKCTEWLIQENSSLTPPSTFSYEHRTHWKRRALAEPHTGPAHSRKDTRLDFAKTCSMCGEERDVKAYSVNVFAHKDVLFLCGGCCV